MLTHQQKRLLDFIIAKIDAEGVAPTFVEMQAALGISSRGLVHRFVGCLEERGFIRRIPARARAIEVIKRPGDDDLQKIKDQLRFAIAWIEGLPCLSSAQEQDKAAALKCLGRPHNVLALTGETPAEANRRLLAEMTAGISDDIAQIVGGVQ